MSELHRKNAISLLQSVWLVIKRTVAYPGEFWKKFGNIGGAATYLIKREEHFGEHPCVVLIECILNTEQELREANTNNLRM